MKRGDVYRVRLDPTEGREIKKTRPAIVMSNNVACRFDSVIQIVPITRLPERELRPYESPVSSESSGLARPSRAVANQIRTVGRHRLGKRVGCITADELGRLERAVSIQLGLATAD